MTTTLTNIKIIIGTIVLITLLFSLNCARNQLRAASGIIDPSESELQHAHDNDPNIVQAKEQAHQQAEVEQQQPLAGSHEANIQFIMRRCRFTHGMAEMTYDSQPDNWIWMYNAVDPHGRYRN